MPSPVRPLTPIVELEVGARPDSGAGQSDGQFGGSGTVGSTTRSLLHSMSVG